MIPQHTTSPCFKDTIFSPKRERDSSNFDHTLAVPQSAVHEQLLDLFEKLFSFEEPPRSTEVLKETCSPLFVRDSSAIPDQQLSLADLT